MGAQHDGTPNTPLPPLRTVAEIRAALRQGRGFPGDKEDFEADLAQALDASTATDFHLVAEVIKTYAGSVRAYSDPEFGAALQEGLDLMAEIKKGGRA